MSELPPKKESAEFLNEKRIKEVIENLKTQEEADGFLHLLVRRLRDIEGSLKDIDDVLKKQQQKEVSREDWEELEEGLLVSLGNENLKSFIEEVQNKIKTLPRDTATY